MMSEARAALESVSGTRPLLIAVTILTSLAEDDLTRQGISCTPAEQVIRLMEKLEDLDDVMKVHANFEIDDDEMERILNGG